MAMSEADERYLAEVSADSPAWLGPGATLLELRAEPARAGLQLVARYRLEGRERQSEAVGESLHAAHIALRARVLLDRIGIGLEKVVVRS